MGRVRTSGWTSRTDCFVIELELEAAEEEEGGGGLVRFIFYWGVFLAWFWINSARCS